jgi:hypothetical protein
MRSQTWCLLASLIAVPLAPSLAQAKKKQPTREPVASVQTQRAISELAGKFKWGMSPEEATELVTSDIEGRYDERIKKETNAFRQDAVRQEMGEQIKRFRDSYVEFKGQKTGWDVSIVDREFAHKNNEAMMVIWEKDQRRFLFFHDSKLWKQFIAFNQENPVFAGKSFDDFADLIQKRYGPASMTFRKLKTSDDQTLDHLEWPASGDYVLWAIDLTSFYGNFCLSLFQRSQLAEIENGRRQNSPETRISRVNVDDVLKEGAPKDDANADIIDKITGHDSTGLAEEPATTTRRGGKGKTAAAPAKGPARVKGGNPRDEDRNKQETAADPLEGSGL